MTSGERLTDVHSHLVPGVDDGSRTLEETLAAVARMAEARVGRIVTTPHLDGALSRRPSELSDRLGVVDEAFRLAAEALAERGPDVELLRGHEVLLDVPDVDFSDARMRLAGTSFVLVEWPRLRTPQGSENVVRRIVSDGYRPIIAHPERYIGIERHVSTVAAWREAGACLQVNAGSIVGKYGSEARRVAMALLRTGWADLLASDFHGRPESPLLIEEARERIEGSDGAEAFSLLYEVNPARVARGEDPLPVPLLPSRSGVWERMKGILSSGDA